MNTTFEHNQVASQVQFLEDLITNLDFAENYINEVSSLYQETQGNPQEMVQGLNQWFISEGYNITLSLDTTDLVFQYCSQLFEDDSTLLADTQTNEDSASDPSKGSPATTGTSVLSKKYWYAAIPVTILLSACIGELGKTLVAKLLGFKSSKTKLKEAAEKIKQEQDKQAQLDAIKRQAEAAEKHNQLLEDQIKAIREQTQAIREQNQAGQNPVKQQPLEPQKPDMKQQQQSQPEAPPDFSTIQSGNQFQAPSNQQIKIAESQPGMQQGSQSKNSDDPDFPIEE